MSLCLDKPILVGFLGSFASYALSVLTGRHDYADFICLAQRLVNNPHPAMKAESGVSKNGGILLPTRFKVLGVLFLEEVSSAFLPSKKACWAHQFRYLGVGQQ